LRRGDANRDQRAGGGVGLGAAPPPFGKNVAGFPLGPQYAATRTSFWRHSNVQDPFRQFDRTSRICLGFAWRMQASSTSA
jgi:hypothetical protein